MRKIPELRETFLNIFSNLPEGEKRMPIVVIRCGGTSEPCSWRVVKLEVECETPTGTRMLRQLERMKII